MAGWSAGSIRSLRRRSSSRRGALTRDVPLLPAAGALADRHHACRLARRLGRPSSRCSASSARWSTAWRRRPPSGSSGQPLAARLHGLRACSSRGPIFVDLVARARQSVDHAEPLDARPLAELPLRAPAEPRLLPERLCRPHQPESDADRHGAARERGERHRRRLVPAVYIAGTIVHVRRLRLAADAAARSAGSIAYAAS